MAEIDSNACLVSRTIRAALLATVSRRRVSEVAPIYNKQSIHSRSRIVKKDGWRMTEEGVNKEPDGSAGRKPAESYLWVRSVRALVGFKLGRPFCLGMGYRARELCSTPGWDRFFMVDVE